MDAQQLGRELIRRGWPKTKDEVPEVKALVDGAKELADIEARLKRLDALACELRLYVRRRDIDAAARLRLILPLVEAMRERV